MKRILKEPLCHFLLLGAGLFLAYRLMPGSGTINGPQKVVVTQGQIEHLAASFARTWQRPPSPQELAGLVRDQVKEEVYCREAMALGLDKDDIVIRRRLRQKMEFVSENIAAQAEPTDADLNAYLQAHPDQFRVEPQFTFQQVYLNPQKHGEHLKRDAAELLAQLNQASGPVDPASKGDSLLLEQQFTAVTASEVAKQFGEKFAAQLSELQPGQWQGPVESAYGAHLVFVSERAEGRLPALADVHETVRREWANARRLDANEKFYEELLKRYSVTIEEPKPTAQPKKLAANNTK